MSFYRDRESAASAAERLRLFAQPQRLMILSLLQDVGEQSVAEIDQVTRIGQPALSQQLGELRRRGEVTTRRQAKQVFYSLANPHNKPDIQMIQAIFGEASASLHRRENAGQKEHDHARDDGAASFVRMMSIEE
ncbi:ArsR/SmtB family transcription factor [Novosphingobium sp.]|uniref:ArsR/SmtB family transcription factor n=1 Tax=Novosphingobium sp. TaxID=1874826 RepID=UPI002FE2E981